jgi:hypothetical protein
MKKLTFVIVLLIGVISFSLNSDKIVLAGNQIFDYESINNIKIEISSNFEDRDFKPIISFNFDTEKMNYSYSFYINTRSINPTYRDLIDEDNYSSSGFLKDLSAKYDFLSNFTKQIAGDTNVVDVYNIIRNIIY